MFWYGNGMNGWGYGLMGFGMLVFWVVLIGVVVLALRLNRSPDDERKGPPTPPTADQLLAERFARGEIDQQEYVDRQAALRAHVH